MSKDGEVPSHWGCSVCHKPLGSFQYRYIGLCNQHRKEAERAKKKEKEHK